jgi:hypothetical protein
LLQTLAWIATTVTLLFTAYQVYANTKVNRETMKVNRANFWLELRKMFAQHENVHLKLMLRQEWGAKYYEPDDKPGELWVGPTDNGPKDRKQWRHVEDYMGLFEHCERMLKDELIDPDTFKSIYGYRLNNILWNRPIVQTKLHDPTMKKSYEQFIGLLHMLGKDPVPNQARRER